MHIGIIGGGFTGLTAAFELTKHGHNVTIFEKEKILGGLAHGFRGKDWDWPLEFAYHHLFTNDSSILTLIDELEMKDALIIKRPVTATYYNGTISQLDSPGSLLRYRELPFIDRLRTGAVMAGCKLSPIWQPLEHYTAENFFRPLFGHKSWNVIWEPLLYGKFGERAPSIAASWLWARIYKRTTNLVYLRGGFQTLVDTLDRRIQEQGGIIRTDSSISSIQRHNKALKISWGTNTQLFDKVLSTVPTPITAKILPDLPQSFIAPFLTIPHLNAQLLILETNEPILKDIYWLNVNDRSFPFLAVVAHTNLINPSHYGGHHVTYFGNYLPQNHPYLSYSKEKLLKTFLPYIKRLSPSLNTKYSILHTYLFTGPFAQPVHEVNYSQKAPPLKTPIPNVFLANMDSIFPWDRGTNYAVELGLRAAHALMNE